MEERQVLAALGSLSQETRLRIVRHLIQAGPDGVSAGQIGEAVGASSSRLSFHLSNLEHSGLIDSRRESRNIVYSASFEDIGSMLRYLMRDCCGNHPDILAQCAPDQNDSCC